MGLDLKNLDKLLDDALAKETKESLESFLGESDLIRDVLISFSTAKLAYEKGFRGISLSAYDINGDAIVPYYGDFFTNGEDNGECLYEAPTQSLLQKWLRDRYMIEITINSFVRGYQVQVTKDGSWVMTDVYTNYYKTYEDALEVGLVEGMKLVD